MLGQLSPETFASKLWTQIEPLHFTNAGFELVERDAARELTFIFRQQQAAFGGRVIAGQTCEFLVEILKAQAESERLGVLEKQFTSLRNLRGG